MTKVYDVHYLQHYADRYVSLRLHAHGVTLEQYLANPDRYEHLQHEPEPLMLTQRMVRDRLDALDKAVAAEGQVADLTRREVDRAPIERLRHHRWRPWQKRKASQFQGQP